jgi:hypothetical protein
MKKGEKKGAYIVFSVFIAFLLITTASAGWVDWVKQTITGKATSQTFDLNITVGAPSIYAVYNLSDYLPIQEEGFTELEINFSVYAPSGSGNLNHSSSKVNISFPGEDLRENVSCNPYESGGDYANYTCNITMWWWDINETWTINAYIEDNAGSSAINTSATQDIGQTRAFKGGPTPLTWPGISPGDSNKTSNNDPYLMNNTGNVPIASSILKINSTNLRGEITPTEALWAGNFSVGWNTGGSPPAECGGTSMVYTTYTALSIANLSKGNYTINDGSTGQERLYFCLKEIGAELSTQAYSTANESGWTVDITGLV